MDLMKEAEGLLGQSPVHDASAGAQSLSQDPGVIQGHIAQLEQYKQDLQQGHTSIGELQRLLPQNMPLVGPLGQGIQMVEHNPQMQQLLEQQISHLKDHLGQLTGR